MMPPCFRGERRGSTRSGQTQARFVRSLSHGSLARRSPNLSQVDDLGVQDRPPLHARVPAHRAKLHEEGTGSVDHEVVRTALAVKADLTVAESKLQALHGAPRGARADFGSCTVRTDPPHDQSTTDVHPQPPRQHAAARGNAAPPDWR